MQYNSSLDKFQYLVQKAPSELHYKAKDFVESYAAIHHLNRLESKTEASQNLHDRAKRDLPCLYSNNSDKINKLTGEVQPDFLNNLQPYQKKAVYILYQNTDSFLDALGLNNVGFLTLTFADNIIDHKEASRRFDNLRRRFITENFGCWMWVKERQLKRGKKNKDAGTWHFHLLIDCQMDIRTGFDFEDYKKNMDIRQKFINEGDHINARKYAKQATKTANNNLRNFWPIIRDACSKYNFGRSELLPIKSNSEGMARYVGKYIVNHTENRIRNDKGVRLTGYSKNIIEDENGDLQELYPKNSVNFAWNTDNAKKWRDNLKKFFVLVMGYPEILWTDDPKNNLCTKILKDRFGPSWAYHLQDDIMNFNENEIKRLTFSTMNFSEAPY